MNVLFVCSANKQRSRTAEDHFRNKYPEMAFDSAGTNRVICRQEGTNPITEELIVWADRVYVMERKHMEAIMKYGGHNSKIEVLNIPDRFKYGQKELIELLERKVKL